MKKNHYGLISGVCKIWKSKFFKKMRIVTLLILISITQTFALETYAQNKRLSLNAENKTIVSILEEIERQSEFYFMFDASRINVNQRKTVDCENQPIRNILDQLFEDTGITYRINDRQVLLTVINSIVPEQQKSILGKVTDSSGSPLPGVTVVVKGTTQGTVTDADGKYSLTNVSNDAILQISFVGMKTQEIAVAGKTKIDIVMEEETVGIEEVVAVGYGTQKRVNLTGAVTTVKSEDLEKIRSVNSTELLQGQIAGLITKQTTGKPGADEVNLSIRGFGNPLVLVDGMEWEIGKVDPSTIESISVLKDAAAAIYGARAGNGVILITTKRGKYQKDLNINYNGSYSIQQFSKKPSLITNSGIYTEFHNEAEINAGLTPTFTEEEVQKYYDSAPDYESYNWFDYAFKNWAPTQKHNIDVQGGGDNIAFYVGMGLSDQRSVISSDDWWYKRYNVRSNVDGKITENLSFRVDLSYIYEQQAEASSHIWRSVYMAQPMAPTSFPNSDLIPASNLRGNYQRLIPEMNMDIEGGITNNPESLNGKADLEYKIPFVKGLSIKGSLDYYVQNKRTKTTGKQYEVYERDPESGEYTLSGRYPSTYVNNMVRYAHHKISHLRPKAEINYEKKIGNHSIKGLMVGEFYNEKSDWFNGYTENLLSNELMYLSFGDRTYHELNQEVTEASRASIVGRVNYAYAGKYLFETTFRYDASSFFPPNNRWGFFPSVSAGWRISEEPFMANATWLDNLKIRASYSQTGYDGNAIRYDYFSGYEVVAGQYIYGSNAVRKIQSGTLANPDMTWETMTNYNIGFDANLWKGKLALIVDGFYRERDGILAIPTQSLPSTFGASLSRYNLNSLNDRGIDVEISHANNIGDLNYRIKGVVTYARSKWTHYEEEEYTNEDDIRILKNTGNWVNRTIGYVSDGLFRSQEEIDNHPIDQDQAGNSTLIPGDIKYKDLDGDNIITWADQEEIGYATDNPDLTFGLNLGASYHRLSLDVLLQGGSMFSGNIAGYARTPFNNASTPLEIHWEERFDETNNPDGQLPVVTMGVRSNNNRNSDFWLKSVTFLRLKNINLSYSFPQKWITPIGIKRLQTYVSASNLAVISNLGMWASQFDPETNFQDETFPPNRTITLGLNVTF